MKQDITTLTIPAVSRDGVPCPDLRVVWYEEDSWRPGDPPRDPNYSDRYWVAKLMNFEPIDVIELWVHDHSSFGVADFSWEADGTSVWTKANCPDWQFGESGRGTDYRDCMAAAEAVVVREIASWWESFTTA